MSRLAQSDWGNETKRLKTFCASCRGAVCMVAASPVSSCWSSSLPAVAVASRWEKPCEQARIAWFVLLLHASAPRPDTAPQALSRTRAADSSFQQPEDEPEEKLVLLSLLGPSEWGWWVQHNTVLSPAPHRRRTSRGGLALLGSSGRDAMMCCQVTHLPAVGLKVSRETLIPEPA